MFSRCLRRKTISAQSSTYSFKSICCNRNTNSCSTDCYSNLGLLFIFQICSIRGIFSECVSFASLFMLYYNGRKSNTRRFDWPGTVLAVLRTVSLMNLRIPEKMRKWMLWRICRPGSAAVMFAGLSSVYGQKQSWNKALSSAGISPLVKDEEAMGKEGMDRGWDNQQNTAGTGACCTDCNDVFYLFPVSRKMESASGTEMFSCMLPWSWKYLHGDHLHLLCRCGFFCTEMDDFQLRKRIFHGCHIPSDCLFSV